MLHNVKEVRIFLTAINDSVDVDVAESDFFHSFHASIRDPKHPRIRSATNILGCNMFESVDAAINATKRLLVVYVGGEAYASFADAVEKHKP